MCSCGCSSLRGCQLHAFIFGLLVCAIPTCLLAFVPYWPLAVTYFGVWVWWSCLPVCGFSCTNSNCRQGLVAGGCSSVGACMWRIHRDVCRTGTALTKICGRVCLKRGIGSAMQHMYVRWCAVIAAGERCAHGMRIQLDDCGGTLQWLHHHVSAMGVAMLAAWNVVAVGRHIPTCRLKGLSANFQCLCVRWKRPGAKGYE